MNNENSVWLDFVRGISAIIVVLGHLRALTLETYNTIQNKTIFIKFFYFITGLGPQAVMIFFVLSGYFIIGNIQVSYKKNTWSLSKYLIARLSRLYTVLIPALFITLFFDVLGLHFFPNAPFYAEDLKHLELINTVSSPHFWTFCGNLFYLQTILVTTFGSNFALWSLSYEFWYYILFPLVFIPIRHWNKNKFDFRFKAYLPLFVIFSLFLLFFNKNIIYYFLVWMMGGIVVFYKENNPIKKRNKAIVFLSVCLLFASLAGSRFLLFPQFIGDFLIGMSSAFLIYCLTYIEHSSIRHISTFFSKISYSLYLVHLPFLAFFTSMSGTTNLAFGTESFIIYSVLFSMTILFSYIVWLLFESKTHIVKNFIGNAFSKLSTK